MDTQFTFDSGRLCLDFMATICDRHGAALERWETPQHLAAWCVESGLLDTPPSVSSEDLHQAQLLRESLYELMTAVRLGMKPKPQDITTVNRWAARPEMFPKLGRDGRTLSRHAENFLDSALVTVARDGIELLSGSYLVKVRECEGTACSMLFVDQSRPGNRRWCSMERCGNRAKKHTHRQRKRQIEQ